MSCHTCYKTEGQQNEDGIKTTQHFTECFYETDYDLGIKAKQWWIFCKNAGTPVRGNKREWGKNRIITDNLANIL